MAFEPNPDMVSILRTTYGNDIDIFPSVQRREGNRSSILLLMDRTIGDDRGRERPRRT